MAEQWADGHLGFTISGALTLFPQHLNPDPPALADARFRRSLFHAINRQEMVDTFLGGAVPLTESVVSIRDREYRATEGQIVRYPYDPRRAAQLMQDLGAARGADGTFRDAAGQPLSVEIQSVITGEINEKAMLAVADYWRQLGINAVSTPIPSQRQQDREYRMGRSGFDLAGGGTSWTEFHSARTPLPENNFVGSNKTRYMNPEMDGLIDRYLTTIPFDPRRQILGQIVRHISDQVVVMGLFYRADSIMTSKQLEGVVADLPSGASLTWNAHLWELR